MNAFLKEVGGMSVFTCKVLETWLKNFKKCGPLIFIQVGNMGFRSLPTVCFSGFFVGAILILQFHMMLAQYDATSILGGLNSSACLREVGPLLISFILAGKVGAYISAELGTMRVTEQIDAIRCLGTDPMEYLVVPRFIAIVLCSVILLIFGLLVGLLGSMFIATEIHNINYLQYLSSVPRFTNGWTAFCGIFKSIVYGTIVASVSTYKGFTASGGARGVGIAVTECAIYTNLLIVFANSFTSMLLSSAHQLYRYFSLGGIS